MRGTLEPGRIDRRSPKGKERWQLLTASRVDRCTSTRFWRYRLMTSSDLRQAAKELRDLPPGRDRVLGIVPMLQRSGVPLRSSGRAAAVDVADFTSLHGRGAAGLLRSLRFRRATGSGIQSGRRVHEVVLVFRSPPGGSRWPQDPRRHDHGRRGWSGYPSAASS